MLIDSWLKHCAFFITRFLSTKCEKRETIVFAIEDFSTFYDDLTLVKLADGKIEKASGSPALSITYTYSSDDSTDTVKYYSSDGERYVAEINGTVAGHSQKAVINNLMTSVAELVK